MEVGFGVERTLFSPGPNGHNYRHLCFSAVQTGKNIYKQNELRIKTQIFVILHALN